MKLKVTKRGGIIPKTFFAGVTEVDIREENHRILVIPLLQRDPIFELGMQPVECGVSDGAEHHDHYLYQGE